METRRKPGRRAAWVLFAALIVACATAAPAAAMESRGALSPLLEQLARPAVRSLPPAQQAEALGVPPSGPGSLIREGGRVVTEVRFDHGAIARLGDLKEVGARVLGASRRYQSATTAVAPAELGELESVPGLVSAAPSLAPVVYGAGAALAGSEGPCEGGSVISEGLSQLKVDEAREAFALQGKGLTIGVLSDSFDRATEAASGGMIATHAHEDVVSNDLPGPAGTCSEQQTPVDVLEEGPEGADEGRAMLQIIHDLAPKAQLAFATAYSSEEAFARNIERLAEPASEGGAGAQVIVDDVGYFAEPFFQDGPVAAAVNKVTAEGVTYLSAAGNDNLFEGENEIASWEAPKYRDGECPAKVKALLEPAGTGNCMDFNPSGTETDTTFGITVSPGAVLTLDLQWAEPREGVEADLDAYLLNASGSELLASRTSNNISSGRPDEILQWENASGSSREVQLAIDRCFAVCNPAASTIAEPRLKFALLENGGGVTKTEYPESSEGDVVGPTIFGHAAAASAIAVGAIRYNTTAAPERYSSRGPVTHYFGPVEGTTPAAELTPPEEIEKPDVTATDCGATTFFATKSAGVWRFCGTSAAAPHTAAVAALLRQADPTASLDEIRETLLTTADPIGAYGADAIGHGLVNALAAFESLPSVVAPEEGSSVVPPLEPSSGSEPEPEPEPEPTPATAPTPTGSQSPVTPPPVPPTTRFVERPGKVVRTRSHTARVVFRFGSDQAGVSYLCRFDGQAYRRCSARIARRLGLGPHVVRVKARNAAGILDASPAVFRFRVKRVR